MTRDDSAVGRVAGGPQWSAEELAGRLDEARRGSRSIAPLLDWHPDLTIADAYAIQRAGRESRLHAGERLIGHKVGLTSLAMQKMVGVHQPDFGYLLDSMALESGRAIESGSLIAPRVEPEIAFVLRAGLHGPGVTPDAVLAATAEVAPALEIIDSRIVDWRIAIVDTIADNASSAMVVLGEQRPLGDLDLASVRTRLEAGDYAVVGRGDAVLGHPAWAVAWLANALAEYGEWLAEGQVVLPGAMTKALPVGPGDRAYARFDSLGDVSVRFKGEAEDG